MKRLFLILLLGLLSSFQSYAQFDYETNADDTLTVTGYYGTNADVVIPPAINGLPVTVIGGGAFYSLFNVRNVSISYGIGSIGEGAFQDDTNLTTITIAGSVTNISFGAFWDCGLTNVFIPASVEDVDDAAFYECVRLANVTISNGVANLGRDAFYGCSRLSQTSIPASVTNVGPYAFLNCTNLEAILVDPQNSYYSSLDGVLFDKSQTDLQQFPEKLGGSYVIPPQVSLIQPFAFAYSANLTNVILPTNAASIPDSVFFECTSLVDVPIPASFTNIGGSSFENCSNLTTVVIPDSVTTIGAYAFAFCDGLTNISISDNITLIDDGTFYYCSSLPKVVIPGAVTSIGSGAFFECSSLTNAALPGSLTNIGDYSFSFCPLGNIQIPTNLSTIGPWAFESCAVTNLVIPPNVTSISNGAFDESTGLQSVTIFGSGIAIAPDAFFGCESLTNLFFAGNAPILAPSVFAYDSNVTAYYLDGTTGWGEFTDSSGVPAVLWNPVIQAVGGQFGIEGNQFGFDITGTTNIPIVVEACTNLANPFWIPLQSLTLTNGIFYFAEPFQSNNPSRFYRISSP